MKIALTSVLLLGSAAIAQETATSAQASSAGGPQVAGALGVDFSTHYYFRGILQEDQDVVAQPWMKLCWGLGDACSEVKNVTFTMGMWNSLHDGPTGSGGAQSMWYENDFYATLSAAVAERWNVGTTYTNYYSPNARFGTVQEIAFSVAYDDNGKLGEGFAGLQPSFQLALELDGQADAGSDRGIYAQLGVAPKFGIGKLGQTPVSLTVPLTIGLSFGDYYEFATGSDDLFGYADLGVVLSAPLSFLPSRMGPWDGYVSLHLMVLGDNNETVNHNENTEIVFTCGMSTTF